MKIFRSNFRIYWRWIYNQMRCRSIWMILKIGFMTSNSSVENSKDKQTFWSLKTLTSIFRKTFDRKRKSFWKWLNKSMKNRVERMRKSHTSIVSIISTFSLKTSPYKTSYNPSRKIQRNCLIRKSPLYSKSRLINILIRYTISMPRAPQNVTQCDFLLYIYYSLLDEIMSNFLP